MSPAEPSGASLARLQLMYPDVKVLDMPPPAWKSSHTMLPPTATVVGFSLERPTLNLIHTAHGLLFCFLVDAPRRTGPVHVSPGRLHISYPTE